MAGTRLLLIPTCALSICLSVNAEPEQAVRPSAAGLVEAALERTQHRVRYDGRYVRIGYPGGDVPADTGVCSDLVIRSYRQIGIDLQVLVHEDIENHFSEYPHLWGMSGPDTNIDHRRVPNLQTFFARHGESLGISLKSETLSKRVCVTSNNFSASSSRASASISAGTSG